MHVIVYHLAIALRSKFDTVPNFSSLDASETCVKYLKYDIGLIFFLIWHMVCLFKILKKSYVWNQ